MSVPSKFPTPSGQITGADWNQFIDYTSGSIASLGTRVGVGGSGSGVSGSYAKWISTGGISPSLLSEVGSNATLSGSLVATGNITANTFYGVFSGSILDTGSIIIPSGSTLTLQSGSITSPFGIITGSGFQTTTDSTLGRLTLVSGSNIILQSGSMIPFALPASYVIFSGSIAGYTGNYYAINGYNNNIDFNNSDAGTVIQNCVNALDSGIGGIIHIKNGIYPIGNKITVLKNAITIEGEGIQTRLDYSGSDACIEIGDDVSSFFYDSVKEIRINCTNTTGSHSAIRIKGNTYYGQLDRLRVSGRTGSTTAIEFQVNTTFITGWHIINPFITAVYKGIVLTGSGPIGQGVTASNIFGGFLNGQSQVTIGSVGIYIDRPDTFKVFGTSINAFETGVKVTTNGTANEFHGLRFESITKNYDLSNTTDKIFGGSIADGTPFNTNIPFVFGTFGYNKEIIPSGSGLVLQSGSIVPFALPASYVIFSGSVAGVTGPYYAINGATNGIDFSGTDCVTVAQNVVNSLPNGGLVFIKKGVYTPAIHGTALLITGSGIILQGEGWGGTGSSSGGFTGARSATRWQGTITIDATLTTPNTTIYGNIIKDMRIELDSTDRTLTGVTLKQTTDCLLDNLNINGYGTGILIDGETIAGYFNTCNRIRIIDNGSSGMTYGIYISSGSQNVNLSNSNRITNCQISAITGSYINAGQDTYIFGTDFSNNFKCAIATFPASNGARLTVEKCYFEIIPTVFQVWPESTFDSVLMYLRDNTWGTNITNKFSTGSAGNPSFFPKEGSIIDDSGLTGGTQVAPLAPNNTAGWYNVMWTKISSGTVLTSGVNVFKYYSKFCQELSPFIETNIQTFGGMATPFTVRAFATSNTNEIRLDVITSTTFTLTSDLVIKLRIRF